MKQCETCKEPLKEVKKKAKKNHRDSKLIRYCSNECFQKYLDSEEFDIELCKALDIENEKGDNI